MSSLESFFDPEDVKPEWGAPMELETRLRIKLSVAAYAYEFEGDSIMTDGEFDKQCRKVNVNFPTGNKRLDNWFKKNFDPSTGQWIHNHPDRKRLKQIYEKHYKNRELPQD